MSSSWRLLANYSVLVETTFFKTIKQTIHWEFNSDNANPDMFTDNDSTRKWLDNLLQMKWIEWICKYFLYGFLQWVLEIHLYIMKVFFIKRKRDFEDDFQYIRALFPIFIGEIKNSIIILLSGPLVNEMSMNEFLQEVAQFFLSKKSETIKNNIVDKKHSCRFRAPSRRNKRQVPLHKWAHWAQRCLQPMAPIAVSPDL